MATMETMSREEFQNLVRQVLHEEMERLTQELAHGKFYQNLVLEMESGIGEIYREINEFKQAILSDDARVDESRELLSDASDQLEGIVATTEEATNRIMDAVEACQQRSNRAARLLASFPASEKRGQLQELLGAMNQDYMEIITACSFQDITGQKVKRVIDLIRVLEEQVITLLVRVTTKLRAKESGADERETEAQARAALKKLRPKGERGFNQEEVDALLAELRGE